MTKHQQVEHEQIEMRFQGKVYLQTENVESYLIAQISWITSACLSDNLLNNAFYEILDE
jgi:hypothetical protein